MSGVGRAGRQGHEPADGTLHVRRGNPHGMRHAAARRVRACGWAGACLGGDDRMSVPGCWKHVGTVLGGALGAQAMPLLAAPLITRMCTPSEMGAFSVWLGVVAVSSIAATLRLETAMILDHEPEQQRVCFSVVLHSASITAVLVSLAAMI